MLPVCMLIDLVIWPDPEAEIGGFYLFGMLMVIVSFTVVSLAKDELYHHSSSTSDSEHKAGVI